MIIDRLEPKLQIEEEKGSFFSVGNASKNASNFPGFYKSLVIFTWSGDIFLRIESVHWCWVPNSVLHHFVGFKRRHILEVCVKIVLDSKFQWMEKVIIFDFTWTISRLFQEWWPFTFLLMLVIHVIKYQSFCDTRLII